MELCAVCNTLGISQASFLSHPDTDDNQRLKDPIREIGYLSDVGKRKDGCVLCRLIYEVFRFGLPKRVTSIADAGTIAIFAKWINALGSERSKRLRSPTIYIMVWAVSSDLPPSGYKILVRAASAALPSQPHFGCITPTPTSFLDYTQLVRWLQNCDTQHTLCKSPSSGIPTRYFYLVDTRSHCIVEPVAPCRYLALSYVWGGVDQLKLKEDNFERLKTAGGINVGDLSKTVRDAVLLTNMLGERFLWVDSLCVMQDSEMKRPRTLADMDRIYAQSLLTIVAASGSNANEGLPGVSVARKRKQWYQKLSPNLILSAHVDFKDVMEDSVYNTRAWT